MGPPARGLPGAELIALQSGNEVQEEKAAGVGAVKICLTKMVVDKQTSYSR